MSFREKYDRLLASPAVPDKNAPAFSVNEVGEFLEHHDRIRGSRHAWIDAATEHLDGPEGEWNGGPDDLRKVLAARNAERERFARVVEDVREATRRERDRRAAQFYDPAYSSGSRRASPLLDDVAAALAALDGDSK